MKNVGLTINQNIFEDLDIIEDIIYYDGPILSHGKNSSGKDYVIFWIDHNEALDRWLVFEVEEYRLYQFLIGVISLKRLVMDCFEVYLVDVADDIVKVCIENTLRLPQDYMPTNNFYFKLSYPVRYKDLSFKYSSLISQINSGLSLVKEQDEKNIILDYVNSFAKQRTMFTFKR